MNKLKRIKLTNKNIIFILLFVLSYLIAENNVMAQRRGGSLDLIASFNFATITSSAKITKKETEETISLSSPTFSFKLRGGAVIADIHFIYLYTEIINGGAGDNSSAKFRDDKLAKFGHDITGQGFGIGYIANFGKQSRGSFNYSAGIDIGSLKYKNAYRGGSLFSNVEQESSFSPIVIFGGVNYLGGTSDLHADIGYIVASETEPEELKNVLDTDNTYTGISNISGLIISFGVSQYF